MAKHRKQSTAAQFAKFMQPVIDALRALGGSGRPKEVKQWIQDHLDIPDELLDTETKSGETKFSNQVDWARFYLARTSYLDSSKRGVWALTEKGRKAAIDSKLAMDIQREVIAELGQAVADPEGEDDDSVAPDDGSESATNSVSESHRSRVLDLIRSLPPAGFENLCKRLLRESGFASVTVTGSPGDRGIDGYGILQLNSFVSFRVMFQCKRYGGSVGPGEVRDFRGAMQGRSEKGLLITTGAFTSGATEEASRDGAPPIELVDGEALVKLLEELELGLRPVRAFEIDRSFFSQFA